MTTSDKIFKKDGIALTKAAKLGHIKPEDYPGKGNEAFRLLIRSLR